MRHTFYANNRNSNGKRGFGAGSAVRSGCYRFSSGPGTKTKVKDKGDLILEAKIKAALKANEAAPEVRSEILEELSMYRVNISIAREFHDKKSEKDLTKNYINYLNQKSNEKR